MKRRGLSLAETVIALFLLTFAVILCVNLFQLGLRYSGRVEQEAVATLIAQKQIAAIRGWSATRVGAGYHFDDWAPFTNFSAADPDQPGFQLRVTAQPAPAFDPCSAFAAVVAPGNQTILRTSLEKVTVTVSWGSPDPNNQVTLTTLVGDPVREWRVSNPLVITLVTQAGDPLPRGLDAVFRVQGFDDDNRAIPDLVYNWYVVPMDGNGTLGKLIGDHSQATLTHKIRLLNGNWSFCRGPSRCALTARAVFRGQERTVDVIINLAP